MNRMSLAVVTYSVFPFMWFIIDGNFGAMITTLFAWRIAVNFQTADAERHAKRLANLEGIPYVEDDLTTA